MDFASFAVAYIGIGAALLLARLPFTWGLGIKRDWIEKASFVVLWPAVVVAATIYSCIANEFISECVEKDALHKWAKDRVKKKRAGLD